MDGEEGDESTRIRTTLRPVLRVGIAGLLLGPGLNKFLTYGQSVEFFRGLELPAPQLLVLVVGAVEVGVAAALLLDRAPRASALTAIPVMVVAAATAGPSWQNLGVLLAALVLIGIETVDGGVSSTEPAV